MKHIVQDNVSQIITGRIMLNINHILKKAMNLVKNVSELCVSPVTFHSFILPRSFNSLVFVNDDGSQF